MALTDEMVTRIDLVKIANFSPHQQQAYSYVGKKSRIFAGGARGGGKSHLAIATAVLACMMFPGLRVCVIRRSMDELRQQLIDNLLLRLYHPGELFEWRRSTRTAYFPNGSIIYFRSLEHSEDVQKVLGVEFGLVIIDEANQLHEDVIIKVIGSIRAFNLPDWKPTLFCTGNPGGLSDKFFKDRWIRPKYEQWNEEELAVKDEFIFIPFGVNDNPHAPEEYKRSLRSLPPAIRKAWYEGDWDAMQGQFFEQFTPMVHICEPFEIPEHWTRWRGIDLGYGNHPSVCLFAAQNPENGQVFIYDEVATKETTDIFIDMVLNASGDAEFAATFFDPNSMKSRRGETADALSPAVMFEMEGIYVRPAINERINGWMNVKAWLRFDEGKDGEILSEPKMKIFPNCVGLIETIPLQQYVTGRADLNTKGQDDYVDAWRYLMSHIPYGAYLNEHGQVEQPEENESFGTDRYPNAVLSNKQRTRDDVIEERDGVSGSMFAFY